MNKLQPTSSYVKHELEGLKVKQYVSCVYRFANGILCINGIVRKVNNDTFTINTAWTSIVIDKKSVINLRMKYER